MMPLGKFIFHQIWSAHCTELTTIRFSKLVVRVLSYVPGKCTTVIVVNWAKIGRIMKDRKFRV
jgi:hypothetical protein